MSTDARGIKHPTIAEAYYEHIARRVIAGQSLTTIADAVGLERHQVSRILNQTRFKVVLNELKKSIYGQIDDILKDQRASIKDRLESAAPVALTKLLDKMENAVSERVQMESAIHILGLAGHTVVQKRVTADLTPMELPENQQKAMTEALASALLDENVVVVDAQVIPNAEEPTEERALVKRNENS